MPSSPVSASGYQGPACGPGLHFQNNTGEAPFELHGAQAGMSGASEITTGSGLLIENSNEGDVQIRNSVGEIRLDAGDIVLEEALSINNALDTILARDNVTGELYGLTVASLGIGGGSGLRPYSYITAACRRPR